MIKKTSRIKYKYGDCFLEYINFKEDLTQYKYLLCNKNYQRKFNKNQNDNNKFILLLGKVALSLLIYG